MSQRDVIWNKVWASPLCQVAINNTEQFKLDSCHKLLARCMAVKQRAFMVHIIDYRYIIIRLTIIRINNSEFESLMCNA